MPLERLRDEYLKYGSDVPLTGYLGVLPHADGRSYSTELNRGVQDPRLNGGRPSNVPLLVPGQVDIEALLAGAPVSEEQDRRAIRFALHRQARGAVFPSFDNWDLSDTYARARHDALVQGISGYLDQGPNGLPLATPTAFDRSGHDLRRGQR